MTNNLSKNANKVFNIIKRHLSQFTGENAGYSDICAEDVAKMAKMDVDEVNNILEELKEKDLIVDGGDAYGEEYAGIIYLKEEEEEEEEEEKEEEEKEEEEEEKEEEEEEKEEEEEEEEKPKKTKKEEPKKEQKKEKSKKEQKKEVINKKKNKNGGLLIKKADLAKKMQEYFHGSADLFQNIISKLVDIIREELMAGNKVKIAGLGIFKVRHLAPRMVWNPIKGESQEVGASARLVFSVENGLKQYFNNSLK